MSIARSVPGRQPALNQNPIPYQRASELIRKRARYLALRSRLCLICGSDYRSVLSVAFSKLSDSVGVVRKYIGYGRLYSLDTDLVDISRLIYQPKHRRGRALNEPRWAGTILANPAGRFPGNCRMGISRQMEREGL